MKPLIGVSASMELDESYYKVTSANIKAIIQAGGIPVMLPHYADENSMDQIAAELDGLYLTGGYDIDPALFGEEPHPDLGTIIPSRDPFEMGMVNRLLDKNMPILAICRGTQILNIAMGGDMYQDIHAQHDRSLLQHSQIAPLGYRSHLIDIAQASMLHQLIGRTKIRVNSHHHQANRTVETPLKVSAMAGDWVIEAIESNSHRFVLGLQWHPEHMLADGDESSQKIYNGFVEACIHYQQS